MNLAVKSLLCIRKQSKFVFAGKTSITFEYVAVQLGAWNFAWRFYVCIKVDKDRFQVAGASGWNTGGH